MASDRFVCRHVFIVRCKLASLLNSVLYDVSLTCIVSPRLFPPTIARLVLTYVPLVYKNTLLARMRGAVADHSRTSSGASNHLMSTDELVRAAPPALAPIVREMHRAAEAHSNSVVVFPMRAAAVLMAYALLLIADAMQFFLTLTYQRHSTNAISIVLRFVAILPASSSIK